MEKIQELIKKLRKGDHNLLKYILDTQSGNNIYAALSCSRNVNVNCDNGCPFNEIYSSHSREYFSEEAFDLFSKLMVTNDGRMLRHSEFTSCKKNLIMIYLSLLVNEHGKDSTYHILYGLGVRRITELALIKLIKILPVSCFDDMDIEV